MFCELAVIAMVLGQPTQIPTEWRGGARTKAEGGLTKQHCEEYVKEYNLTHEKQLVCICKK